MNILVKIPTRGRPEQCRKIVMDMRAMADGPAHYLISVDADDPKHPDLSDTDSLIVSGTSTSKIHAINRDVNECAFPWDILVVGSDDMWPVKKGWDTVIREDMARHYPDTDGMLWYPDGYQKRISTMPILGAKYYRRFGYVYHPSYLSTHCDNEQTEVAQAHGKVVFIDRQLFDHRHPANGVRVPKDETYRKCDKDWNADETNYKQRRAKGFPQ